MSFSDEEVERYARHLVLREIGGPGQQRLKAARVLIVGAGGLGAPAALYLAAAVRLAALNANVSIIPIAQMLTEANARDLIGGCDLVLDGTDDFATRFAVNAACVAQDVALVSGAIGRWTGQVGVFAGRPCYRCLVPEIPPDAETCAAVGVVGALAGVIGSMMALETIKLIANAGAPLTGRLFIYDGLGGEARSVRIGPDPNCPVCGSGVSQ